MSYLKFLAAIFLLPVVSGCSLPSGEGETRPEAISFLGEPITFSDGDLDQEKRLNLEKNLSRARAEYQENPEDLEAVIWFGRRTAYLGRYNEAVSIFTDGLARHPDSPELLRHRGHRFITLRRLDEAIADLERATQLIKGKPDETEADGIPNSRNIPTSTLQSNIWYHLGLAYYLRGDFTRAARCYRKCLDVSRTDDMFLATAYWLYMTLRRLENDGEAIELLSQVKDGLDIIENGSYYNLLKLYKGQLPLEDLLDPNTTGLAGATIGYGIGNWYLVNQQTEPAMRVFQEIVNGKNWAAFGYIASEAELARHERR